MIRDHLEMDPQNPTGKKVDIQPVAMAFWCCPPLKDCYSMLVGEQKIHLDSAVLMRCEKL